MEKSVAETYSILCRVYGKHAPSQNTCERWFKCFKNDNFSMKDNDRPGRSSAFEDQELQALLNEDACQTQKQLALQLGVAQQKVSDRLKEMGKILKEGK